MLSFVFWGSLWWDDPQACYEHGGSLKDCNDWLIDCMSYSRLIRLFGLPSYPMVSLIDKLTRIHRLTWKSSSEDGLGECLSVSCYCSLSWVIRSYWSSRDPRFSEDTKIVDMLCSVILFALGTKAGCQVLVSICWTFGSVGHDTYTIGLGWLHLTARFSTL